MTGQKYYKNADLNWIRPLADEAKKLMDQFIDENQLRDGGTCVMGEGIDILVVPPRCRKPIQVQIVRQPFQGNNERALLYAKQWLESKGVQCSYNAGRMD